MEIRKSTQNDIEDILKIYAAARDYMTEHGNATQWGNGYPGKDILIRDIMNSVSYVLLDKGSIVGTFSFIIGDEPTYQVIKDGTWNYNKPYGTIHRLASNGKVRGIAKASFDFCSNLMDYIRIDTHKNNIAMRAAIEKYGFQKCGIIYVRDGSERIAYDFY